MPSQREGPTDPASVPAEPRPPAIVRLGVWWVVALGIAAGVLWAATDHMLRATVTIAGSCLLGGVLRAVLPENRAGGLLTRWRWLDVLTLILLGVAVGAAGFALDLRARV